MKKYIPFRMLKGAFVILLGTAVASYGAGMAFKSGMGTAPMSMLEEGISITFGIELGTAIWIVCVILLAGGWFLERRSIGLTSVLTSVTYGWFVHLLSPYLPIMPEGIVGRLAYTAVGVVISSFGAAIYLRPGMGGSPVEIAMLYLSKKTGWSFAVTRVITDAMWFVLGLLLGGTWGLGTLISLFLCGPALGTSIKVLDRLTAGSAASDKNGGSI